MITVLDVYTKLAEFAPIEAKMDFDNVGHLVGASAGAVTRILLSLDITSDVIAEAADVGAELIVSHHPLFFSLKEVTDATVTGRKVIALIRNNIAAVCMHTNLDAARGGVNDRLAAAAGLINAEVMPDFPYGRFGFIEKPAPLAEYLSKIKDSLHSNGLRYYDAGRPVRRVAVVGGSGGSELPRAVGLGCDTLLTADVKYDVFLDAKELGVNLIDGDHFCTENVVLAALEEALRFPGVRVARSARHGQTARFF
ncbi:MAG: Nif3-like dinuclear metal center hexameric protein [Oscillospiraceae bacterium]|jgi:dinuclear metal center YbgI/SA1388 family protein|nr:Nif3-like dinuclear metal center hexameric protein [Oscillospiraceae bacterium]